MSDVFLGDVKKIRPHRRDGYVHRVRVHVRMHPDTHAALKEIAASLHMSVSHFMDVLGAVAVEEGGEWLCDCMRSRVEEALTRACEVRKRGF